MKRPGCSEYDPDKKSMVYTKLPDPGAPARFQTKRVDAPDEAVESAIRKHPLAWLLLTAKRAEEDRV